MTKFFMGTFTFLVVLTSTGCNEVPLYQKGKYTIKKKDLMSYYSASPDLFVKTDSGTAKINLNPFCHNLFPQEYIQSVQLTEIGSDSINIYFTARKDSASAVMKDSFGVNIKYCLDSIFGEKH